MKIFYKKIISMVLILSVLSGVLILPASATPGAAVDYVSGQLWDLIQLQDIDTGLLFWKNLLKSYLAPGVTESTATAADWAVAYGGGSSSGGGAGRDSYVSQLPSNGVGSDGCLYFTPYFSDFNSFYCAYSRGNSSISNFDAVVKGLPYIDTKNSSTFSLKSLSATSYFVSYTTVALSFKYFYLNLFVKAPIAGSYSVPSFIVGKSRITLSDGTFIDNAETISKSAMHCNINDSYCFNMVLADFGKEYNYSDFTFVSSIINMPRIKIVPDSGLVSVTDGAFAIGTRFPGGGLGGGSSGGGGAGRDLPYIGKKDDTGKLTAVSGAVFDEKAGTYMNPFDGVVKNVKSWTYDYTTRAYTLTLADGTTVVLTYGDDNVTIVEGGKTYTFYYLIPAAVTPSPSPSVPPVSPSPSVPPVSPSPGCNHVYTDKILQKPTCTVAGSMERSCSLCGGSIIEKIPASGHDWLLTNSVADVLGADGKVVTEGYDLYKCSVCHLEYKDFARTGPPGKDVGNSISKLITDLFDSLGVLIGKGIDWLLSLGTKAMAGFTQVTDFFAKQAALVGGFGGGFLLFLSSAFALIPPELLACITFALICAVLGMVAKLVFLK